MKRLLSILVVFILSTTIYAQSSQNYLLGDVNRDGKVTVADVMMVVNIIMKGYTPFSVNPTSVTMPAGGTATVDVVSGYYQYDVTSSNTDVVTASLNGSTITLTAVASGEATVTVKDVLTMRYVEIPVTVDYSLLQVSSSELSLIVGGTGTVEVTSGSGSYSVESSDAEVATAVVDGTSVKVTAVGAGTATITVTDTKSGQTSTISLTVDHKPLALSSNSLTLIIGDEGSVNITSGSGNYSVESSDENVVFAELDGNAVSILAFGGGSATITVTDTQSGQTATIEVTVDYLPLALSTSSLTLTVGEESTVNITSGNAFFTVRSSDTSIATASLSDSSIKVTAVAAGTATITVTDRRSGQAASIEVTVTAPSVSLCPDDHHPHLIDLGLPSGTKWACCNVDTDHPEKQSPTNYGGHYAWGETETKSVYNDVTYLYATGEDENGDGWYDDYHSDTGIYGVWQNLGSDIAGTQYDVAHVKWGGSWVMPSYDQQTELEENCTYEWTSENGVNGGKFTSKKNGVSIFLPAAGYRGDSGHYDAGSGGYYWSSTQYPSRTDHACSLYFDSGGTYTSYGYRGDGFTVRPVSRN